MKAADPSLALVDRKEVVRRWDVNASWWSSRLRRDRGGDEMRAHVVSPYLVSRFRGMTPGTVLDIGCGEGHALRLLTGLGWRGVGFDWSEDMIRSADRVDGQEVLVADAEEAFPFQDATFHAVVSSMVLMDLREIGKCARESRRVARPGAIGEFIILNPDFVAREEGAIHEIGERHSLPPPEQWCAWVRIAPDQPVPTLYFQRPVELYAAVFAEAGWRITGTPYLSAATAANSSPLLREPAAVAISTRAT